MTSLEGKKKCVGLTKLMPVEGLLGYIKAGSYIQGRCLGRSTANALEVISKVMKHPREPYVLPYKNIRRDANFIRLIESLIAKLELKYIRFKRVRCTVEITYDIYRTGEEDDPE